MGVFRGVKCPGTAVVDRSIMRRMMRITRKVLVDVLVVTLFHIDVRGYKKWSFFFVVIGMNSILIYLSGHFIDWEYMTKGFFTWLGQLFGDPWNAFVMVLAYLAVKWVFLYILYRKKIFLRV